MRWGERYVRYGIISDIHGNLEALTAVLEALADERIDTYLCLGDIVGYGANPNECLERVWSLTPHVIAGNHDHAAVGKLDLVYFNCNAAEAALWTMQHLHRSGTHYLRELPLVLRLPEQPGLLGVHATPSEPEQWHYMLALSQASAEFRALPGDVSLCFIGHTHEAVIFEESGGLCRILPEMRFRIEPGKRYIVNVGSVGQPRDGDLRGACGVYDAETGEVEVKRVAYDIPTAQKKIRQAGLPMFLAERLAVGR